MSKIATFVIVLVIAISCGMGGGKSGGGPVWHHVEPGSGLNFYGSGIPLRIQNISTYGKQ